MFATVVCSAAVFSLLRFFDSRGDWLLEPAHARNFFFAYYVSVQGSHCIGTVVEAAHHQHSVGAEDGEIETTRVVAETTKDCREKHKEREVEQAGRGEGDGMC
jgi:hypothetical protein